MHRSTGQSFVDHTVLIPDEWLADEVSVERYVNYLGTRSADRVDCLGICRNGNRLRPTEHVRSQDQVQLVVRAAQ